MTTTKREMLIAELANAAKEWNCTHREALLEILYLFYENEFPVECLEKELRLCGEI